MRAICWSPERSEFCAVGTSNSWLSADGLNWTAYQHGSAYVAPGGDTFGNVIWIPEWQLYIALAPSGVAISSDGKTWVDRSVPAQCATLAYSPELRRVVAVGESVAMYSNDGYWWTNSPYFAPIVPLSSKALTWCPEPRCFVTAWDSFSVTSRDGILWTDHTTSLSGALLGIAWSPELRRIITGREGGGVPTIWFSDVTNQLQLAEGTNINEFSSDVTLAGNSDLAVPTEHAVKTYVDTVAASKVAISDYNTNNASIRAAMAGGFNVQFTNSTTPLISYPTQGASYRLFRVGPRDMTLLGVHTMVKGGTSVSGNFLVWGADGLGTPTNICSENMVTMADTVSNLTSLAVSIIPAGCWLGWTNTSITGVVTRLMLPFDWKN
jgi:hypothetical protein